MIKAILAVGENGEIGQNGDMPWGKELPKDLAYFKEQTLAQVVLLGRTTRDNLPFKNKVFPERYNCVLTSNPTEENEENFEGVAALLDAFKNSLCGREILYLVGGASVYKQFWEYVEEVHITRVKHSFPEADTFFKPDLTGFEKIGEDTDVSSDKYEACVEVWRRVK